MSLSLHEVAEALVPRRYQEEIFSRAQERNVIAALDTGSGKTYISTLLIKWIVTRDAGQGKICVFLVPKVALVDQQGDFIAKETGLRVSKRYGSTAIDMTDRRGWRSEIEDHDVLVMTAQIFLNILTHSHWTIDKVSLIVFDECHHTRKNHAYNGIMREYFQESPEKRPKVFGMTASPIWNPRDAAESLSTLERNLDAKVIAVREHVAELADHSPKPREVIVEYEPSPTLYPGYPSTGLWDRLGLSDLPPHIDIPIDRLKTRYDVTYHSLGPYGAELFLYHEMKYRIAQFTNQELEMEQTYVLSDDTPPDGLQLPEELRDMATVLAHCKSFFEDEENPDVVPTHIDLKWCSPKVIRLSQMLFDHYSPTFQGIVFVEQRHVAMCLSKMLPRIPPLELYFKSAQLIGHGANSVQRSNTRGMALRSQRDVVEMFRTREINLLVATSVAEEGLDFPACELVIRFDPIQHMVGYIQSRGRARQKTAAFIVMVQQGHASHVERYKAFSESEPQLRLVYQTRDEGNISAPEEELEEGEEREDMFEHPDDLAERERYVVPSTGAILTYNTSIGLLNHLCSLIPRDRYTPVHLPQYSGDFESHLVLPPTLPLPTRDLSFTGPARRTKKEAKRAVAFMAVKRLHALGVFDDYLLPSRPSSGDNEDADGRTITDVSKIPETMDVVIRDPWTRGKRLWLHYVSLDGRITAGLITGSTLPSADLVDNGLYISSSEGVLIEFDDYDEWRQRRALEDFMRMGLWWCITGRGISLPLTCYLVPITPDLEVDWDVIYNATAHPYGVPDWSTISEEHYNRILVTSSREFGRPLILARIREDLTPMSTPTPGSREAVAATYHEYYTNKFTRKNLIPEIPTDGPCIEVKLLPRRSSTIYALDGSFSKKQTNGADPSPIFTYPQKLCRWAPLSPDIYHTFHILPAFMHRLTDLYRARSARYELGLPPIVDDLLVQALTLPNANAGFNNQRLETLGDSVLKLCTVVHLYNRFPHRHEGQLDVLRRNSVSNRTLLARAKEIQLEQYLTSEPQTMRVWRYTLPADTDLSNLRPRRWASRRIPKRSLQDCMEAILGASYVTGGLSMALHAGNALGLGFGGTLPWRARYGGMLPASPSSPLFLELQEVIGYQFKCGKLLAEAVTHPSFRSPDCSSYQRLEFLGDALIDLVVITYLHTKFPTANSGQLSWARSRAVCAPALAWVAVNKLNLHRILLINNVELSMTMKKYVDIFNGTSAEEIVADGWKHDPPKALSDVLESVLGAAFVDMDYDFEKASVIVENTLQGLLQALSPDMPRDPVSELMVWSAKAGCRKISFRKSQSRLDIKRNDSISVIVHDFAVVGPITASNMSLAKGLAAERARQVLEDEEGPHFLKSICDCDQHQPTPPAHPQEFDGPTQLEPKKLDDETEAGFAALALQVLTSIQPDTRLTNEPEIIAENSFDGEEEEVDLLLGQVETGEFTVDTTSNGQNGQSRYMLPTSVITTNGLNGVRSGQHKQNGHNEHDVAVFTMDVDSDSDNYQSERLLSTMDLTV